MDHRLTLLALSVATAAACAESAPRPELSSGAVVTADAPLVYGADDRREYYELSDVRLRAVADATAAVVARTSLTSVMGGYTLDVSSTYGASQGLCTSEPYRTQPDPAYCTAFMVGTNLVATAGHCISRSSCASTAFAFGFRMDSATTVRAAFPTQDVYFCSAVLADVETSTNDYAVVRVDRTISGHNPLQIRRTGKIATGAAVGVVGHPSGIPVKAALGATVRSNSATKYFSANLDTYGGNSGSPVFNTTDFTVEGILVRGNADFRLSGSCYVSNTCSDTGCPGWEDVTRSTQFASYVPVIAGCTSDAACDDGDPCDGFEVCAAGSCSPGAAPSCDDASACTTDVCSVVNASTWECLAAPVPCDDGNACTTDSCGAASGCTFTPITCPTGQRCSAGACLACTPRNGACTTGAECCSGSCKAIGICR